MTTFKASFKANAGLKDIVGKGLIYDDSIALIELVKNAKDAGSPSVKIQFSNINKSENIGDVSEVCISDSGCGMSKEDIENKWLNIAYSEKKGRSLQGQSYAGNKGVGRFSCDRLGKNLDLYTKSTSGNFIKLPIEWERFENKGEHDEISTISLQGENLDESTFLFESGQINFTTGTVLKIRDLRSEWDAQKLKKLINELEKFSPSLDSSFEVYIYSDTDYGDSELKSKINKKIDNGILDKLAFKTTYIKSFIDSDGKEIETILYFQGQELYSYKADNPYPNLKNIKVEVHYLDTIAKTYFTKNVGINPNSYGSILLFYNGFRISPYGNEKNDWLNLDQRKSQGTSRNLGTREVFGRIDIYDSNDTFSVITSREGLAHNSAYFDLVAHEADEKTVLVNGKKGYGYVPIIIRQLEHFVVKGIDWNRIVDKTGILKNVSADDARKEPHRFQMKSLDRGSVDAVCDRILRSNLNVTEFNINNRLLSEIQAINEDKYQKFIFDFVEKTQNKSLKELSPNEKGVIKKIIDQEIAKRKEAIEEREQAETKTKVVTQQLASEKQTNLYLLSSRKTLSSDADGLVHTIKLNNIDVRNIVDDLIDDLTIGEVPKNELLFKLGNVKLSAEKSLKMAELVTKSNFDKDIESKNIDLITYIKEYLAFYKSSFDNDFTFEFNKTDSKVIRKVSVLNLSIVLDNLLSNSRKWGAQTVRVEFIKTQDSLDKVIFSDSGDGLSEKYLDDPEQIFKLGVRDESPDNYGAGGSGIGLYFTKKLLSEMNAEIKFLGNGVILKGACFEITFD